MQVNILRVRVGRYDDETISKEIVGQKSVSDSSYSEAIVKALTGTTLTDTIKALNLELEGECLK